MQYMTMDKEYRRCRWRLQPDHRRRNRSPARHRTNLPVEPALVGFLGAPAAPDRHLHRPDRDRVLVPGADRRDAADPAQRHHHHQPERVHPDPRHRDGHDHHRRPHRPVGRLGRRLRRRHQRRHDRAAGAGPGGWASSSAVLRRRPGRRLAGLLGRLCRHPGLHRHAGRHADLPGADPDGPAERADHPVPAASTSTSAPASCPTSPGQLDVRDADADPRLRGHHRAGRHPGMRERGQAGQVRARGRAARLVHRQGGVHRGLHPGHHLRAGQLPRHADRPGDPGRAGARLHHRDEQLRLRPPHLRPRRQPAGRRSCRA